MTAIDVLASERHYADHLAPVWQALPRDLRGSFVGPGERPIRSTRPALVASYRDLVTARRLGHRGLVRMEHGAGQSYAGDPRSACHPSYPGGRDHVDVGLFLVPNEQAADRWRAAYPMRRVAVVGSPRLDALPERQADPTTVVAISFHWPCTVAPETRSALPYFLAALPALARRVRLLGHGHPRAMGRLAPVYRSLGIEPVEGFDEVLARADLYVADNSSTLFEFAATGRPVVVLDAPWYRRDIRHGLRFWDAATVGLRVAEPGDLAGTVELALADPPHVRAERERVTAVVYARPTGGAARAAAHAIAGWLAGATVTGVAA